MGVAAKEVSTQMLTQALAGGASAQDSGFPYTACLHRA